MKNSTYDILKWVIAVVLPALAVLVQTIGTETGWGHTDFAVTIITAVSTFLGTVFMVSSHNYRKNFLKDFLKEEE